jgi:ribosomal protein S18 acetylase RimI-like enzyme
MIRRAVVADLEDLLVLCRETFIDSPRWQGASRGGARWWSSVLVSDAAEVWVYSAADRLCAFCILVRDEGLWAREKCRRDGSLIFKVACRLRSLRMVFKWLGKARIAAQAAGDICEVYIPRRNERIWIELIAVSPQMRRLQIGTTLLRFCERRCFELDRKAIMLRVDASNVAALLAYQRSGFRLVARDSRALTYAKQMQTQMVTAPVVAQVGIP